MFLLLAGLGARAGEGFCRGDQERARIVIEALNFRLDSAFEEGFQKTCDGARRGFRWATRLALWLIHAQAWQKLTAGLQDFTLAPSRLMELLRSEWLVGQEILTLSDRAPPAMEMSLMNSVVDSLAAWSVCRSIALGHPEPCGRLELAAPQRYQQCRELFVNFGILFSHRCEPESVTLAAWISGMQFQDALDWCDILDRGAEEKCKLGADQSPHELATCRAMASLDESHCRAPGLTPEHTGDCLGMLATYRYVRGRLPEDRFKPWMYDPVFESAVRSARNLPTGSLDCLGNARRAYLRTAGQIFWLPEWVK